MKNLLIILAITLVSCSKEKQHKTYEFEGILYTDHLGLPNHIVRNVSGKLIMDDEIYGHISFDGVPAVKVKIHNPSLKVKYIQFFSEEDNGMSGGSIMENGEVHYSTTIDYFQGKLK
jgi:hypothetical protein